jgi:hypothetical protein
MPHSSFKPDPPHTFMLHPNHYVTNHQLSEHFSLLRWTARLDRAHHYTHDPAAAVTTCWSEVGSKVEQTNIGEG